MFLTSYLGDLICFPPIAKVSAYRYTHRLLEGTNRLQFLYLIYVV